MDRATLQKFIDQILSVVYDYIHTNRSTKALELLFLVKKVDPDNQLAQKLFTSISSVTFDLPTDFSSYFGTRWNGESLDDKTIEVICDQGIGDTIQMVRYFYQIKERWNCRIVLNCYAFYPELERLMASFPLVEFTKFHTKCDYQTNLFYIPYILNHFLCDYPILFRPLLETAIPLQPRLEVDPILDWEKDERLSVGLAWMTNTNNFLSKHKSIPVENLAILKDPSIRWVNLIPQNPQLDFVEIYPLTDFLATAKLIQSLDLIVSVDTAVLHLAGTLGKRTFGLLHTEADPRWGNNELTPWYPSIQLFRQEIAGDWSSPLREVKERLAGFGKIV